MKISKNTYLLISLLVLVVIALFFRQKNTSLSKKDNIKPFLQVENVDRLEISSSEDSFSISKFGNNWVINNNEEADTKTIQSVFRILGLIQIQSPVPGKNTSELSEILQEKGRTIKLFKNDKAVYVLTIAQDNSGKDFTASPSGKLYYISIKGESKLSLYETTLPTKNEWRDKLLIHLKHNEIASVIIDYPQSRSNGLKLEISETDTLLFDPDSGKEANLDYEAISDYLYFFSGIGYNTLDTLTQVPNINNHLFRLRINTNVSKVIHIEGFELLDRHLQKPNKSEFAGIVNNSILVKLKYSDFDPLLVDRQYFLKK